jgi:hypothetical protein
MGSFRSWPLTWLFFLAALSVAVAHGLRDDNSLVMIAILTGQVFVVAGWAAAGKSHRLARGGLLVVAPLASALSVASFEGSPSGIPEVLAGMMILCAVVFLTTYLCLFLHRAAIAQVESSDASLWRFSIVEVLGWTAVVAIASFTASKAHLPPLEHIYGVWQIALSAVVAGVLVGLFLAPPPRHDRTSLALAIGIVGAYFLGVNWIEDFDSEDAISMGGTFSYVALWTLVVRLDEHAASSAREISASPEATSVKLHAATLDDD